MSASSYSPRPLHRTARAYSPIAMPIPSPREPASPIVVSINTGGSGYVRLTVRDEGPGIPPEHQEQIFGQFERGAAPENLPGMGLGLWLVRRIVTAHGGTVTLDSRPGAGATFTVIVPTNPERA